MKRAGSPNINDQGRRNVAELNAQRNAQRNEQENNERVGNAPITPLRVNQGERRPPSIMQERANANARRRSKP